MISIEYNLNLFALNTWGTKHRSAIVISLPTQNFPEVFSRTFSKPTNLKKPVVDTL